MSNLLTALLLYNAQFHPEGIQTHIHHVYQISQNHRYTQVSEPIALILVVERALYHQP